LLWIHDGGGKIALGDSTYVSASGAVSRLRQLETVANNLANADTTGFKADRAVFHAALESALLDPEGRLTPGSSGRIFVAPSLMVTDHGRGNAQPTGAPLDVAIDGPGFFAIETPAGVRYTRAGSFAVGAGGNLANPDGYAVLGEGGPINLGGTTGRIRSSGEVVDAEGEVVGRLRIVEFAEEDLPSLEKEGSTLFRAPAEAVGIPSDDPALIEGSLERSNVSPVHEMAVLMLLQRSYEATMQILQSDDQATESLIREVSE
jgi:flagellar basal-body rod protein FlgG